VTRARSVPGWLLALLFVGVPLLEIVVLLRVGRAIGPWWTILLMIVSAVVGAWLIKREGRRTVRALSESLSRGRMPAREIADGILILVGGTLMLTPGFVTDVVGILVILPLTRPLARGALAKAVSARLVVPGTSAYGSTSFGPDMKRPRSGPEGDVVRGEVVDDDDQ
jgi:UPF0716 protein FxsA